MHHLEIKHLRLVLVLAKTQNLTKAAATLHLSQPAVSQQLREIEDRLGTPLFLRTRKKMMLTEVGENVLASARTILEKLDTLEYEILKKVQGEAGELKIGIHCAYSFKWIPDAIVKYREIYPNVHLSVGNSWKTLKELTAKTWDMIITIHPFTHELIEYVPLFEDQLSVIMDPKHPLSEKPFLTAKDFEKENFISLTRKEDDLFWKYVLLESGVQLERFTTVEQSEAVISLVKMGLGLSLFPNWAVQEHRRSGELVTKPFTAKGLQLSWQVARLATAHKPIYHETFIDICRGLDKLGQ